MQMRMQIKQSEVYLKVCVKLILGVFSATRELSPFYVFVAFKKIFQEKNTTTFLSPPWGMSGRNIWDFAF